MTTIKQYDFIDETSYTFNSDKIEIVDGKARLKLQQDGVSFTEDFSTDTGFIYDSISAEFTGGEVIQKDQTPSGSTFGATYTSSIDGSWGNGVLTGTAYNGAAIAGNRLDLSGSVSERKVVYAGLNNFDFAQTGCVRFKYTPNYSGAPTVPMYIVTLGGDGNNNSKIKIYHYSNGYVRYAAYDSSGNSLGESIYLWITNVAGTKYEFEYNFDFTAGASRIFLNGNQIGATGALTGTRTASDITYCSVGVAPTEFYKTPNFYLEDLEIFDSVQHTANYTPGYSVPEYRYLSSKVILPEMEHTNPGTIINFNELSSEYSGSPKCTLEIGRSGDELYWNGSSWAVSNETYSQATDTATFNSNCTLLSVDGEIYGQLNIYFDNSSTVQSSISELTAALTVNTQYPTDNPAIITKTSFKSTQLNSISSISEIEGNDLITHVINIDSSDYYWDGEGVVLSSGTYAESNLIEDLSANATAFIDTRSDVKIKSFLHSDDGTTTPELDLINILYNQALGDPVVPRLVNIEGFVYDNDSPLADKVIYVRPYLHGYFNNGIFHDYSFFQMATTDSDGYFNGFCYLQGSGEFWEFKIGRQRYKVALLDQDEMDLKDAPTFEKV